jgi:hypothetical protein
MALNHGQWRSKVAGQYAGETDGPQRLDGRGRNLPVLAHLRRIRRRRHLLQDLNRPFRCWKPVGQQNPGAYLTRRSATCGKDLFYN